MTLRPEIVFRSRRRTGLITPIVVRALPIAYDRMTGRIIERGD